MYCAWLTEITLRDSNAFTGFGQDQCRKYTRVVGANTFRLVLAAARTLWFVAQASRADRWTSPAIAPGIATSRRPANSTSSGPVAKPCRTPEFFPYHGSLRALPQFRRSLKMLYL